MYNSAGSQADAVLVSIDTHTHTHTHTNSWAKAIMETFSRRLLPYVVSAPKKNVQQVFILNHRAKLTNININK